VDLPEEIDREALKARYDSLFSGVAPPFAFVDLDAMRRNAAAMLAQADGLPIRVASKSVRSTAILRRIFDLDPGFRGLLAFTAPEALWLGEQGFDDIVVAYPTVDRPAISRVARLTAENPSRAPVLMVDDRPHLDLIEGSIGGGPARVRVCLDVDLSWWPLGGRVSRIGPKRSPVHDAARAKRMAAEIAERPGTELAGLMGYEGQIAGVGDRIPGRPLRSAAIRFMQARSQADIHRRMPAIVDAVRQVAREHGSELGFINGGGTGSLARTAAAGAVTELTAGSGFYAPHLFDNYRSLRLEPAAFFSLSVDRRPVGGVATLLGGGYVASGPAGRDRLPEPYLPGGMPRNGYASTSEYQTTNNRAED
jgi:D-serine deaminase-like pyridoxal phosphate-dependent protein